MTLLVEIVFLVLLVGGTVYATFWATYVLLLPVLAVSRRPTSGASRMPGGTDQLPSVVVIIPAHDMGAVIERCVGALRDSDYPTNQFEIFVVADHCTDDTAERATAAGATVLIRNDGPPGKTYVLAWSLAELSRRDTHFDLYVITDATARVLPSFLSVMADRWRSGENIVVGHSVVDLANQQWFAQCLGLTLVHRNLQNATREKLRLSSLIEGRGMAYSAAYVRRHGWSLALPTSEAAGTHPTEDWRHGVRAVEYGYRVAFAEDALVATPLRDSLSAATKQGVRWERGRMANAGSHALRLLRNALASKNRLMIFAALDAIQPPVAILAAVSALVAAFGGLVATNLPALRAASMLPLGMVVAYGAIVVARGRNEGIPARTMLWAPVYVLWRCHSFIVALTSSDKPKAVHDNGGLGK